MHQREHSDPCKGCPRKGTSGSVAQKPHVRQGQQQQNPSGDPTKEDLGPIRPSLNDAEDSGGSKRAHSREEDRRARSRQGGELGRNVESGYSGPTNRQRRDDRPDQRLEPSNPQPVSSGHELSIGLSGLLPYSPHEPS